MKDVNILTNNGVNVQASLELLGDMEMYDETLTDFVDMVGEKIANLEKHLAANDMPNYAIEVHALKSDARYLGFLGLGDLCYDSELKAKAGDSAGVTANHPTIMTEVNKAINVANTYLGRATTPSPQQPQAQTVASPAPVQATVAQTPQPQMSVSPEQQVPPQVQSPVVNSQPQAVNPQMNVANQVQNPVQPQAMQPQMPAQVQTPQMGMQPQMNTMSQPQVQTEQIYDLSSGQMITQPVSNPNVQYTQVQNPMQQQAPVMDPMSQALYQQQSANHQMPTSLAPKQGTILVVDDSNLVANFVKKIFDVNYDVVIANDGAKAIELCLDDNFRSKIKACLLDLNMPNVDGYQVLEDFYKKGYFVKMPIAVISGVEDMESIDKVNKYPIIDILAKPFNERDVQRVVEKCLAAYF